MGEKTEKHVETFREYLLRRCERRSAPKGWVTWDRNRGENRAPWSGKNAEKRNKRADHALNRLAQIRAFRRGAPPDGMGASERHVPKLKHIPASVFE